VKVADWPALMVCDAGVEVTAKLGATTTTVTELEVLAALLASPL
jgi:hypothetical protein